MEKGHAGSAALLSTQMFPLEIYSSHLSFDLQCDIFQRIYVINFLAEKIPNVHRGRIYFESLKGKCGMPITYDGVPFIHLGRWSFICHQGVDKCKKQRDQYYEKKREKIKKVNIT